MTLLGVTLPQVLVESFTRSQKVPLRFPYYPWSPPDETERRGSPDHTPSLCAVDSHRS